nr:hypothetical protein CFP56_28704 [Quercus suber]
MMGLNATGRDWGTLVNWDSLGKAYAGIIIAWTIVLAITIAWLLWNRRRPYIRMRNLPLAITSTALLHVYLVKIFLAYTTNGHFLCSAEFWIMSVYLPLGIALFQANALQLRNISDQQQKLLERPLSPSSSLADLLSNDHARKRKGTWSWRSLTQTEKAYVYIATGMLIQATGQAFLKACLIARDRHCVGSLTLGKDVCVSIPRTYAFADGAIRGSHRLSGNLPGPGGLDRILSIWLPGTPLWLAALYSDAFKPLNKWWVPPMWLAPGIVVMQFVTIMLPVYGHFRRSAHTKCHPQEQYRPSCESSRHVTKPCHPAHTDEDLVYSDTKLLFDDLMASGISPGKGMYRMAALDRALAINPAPLLYFAARKDFSAENILFLLQVRSWRNAWRTAPVDPVTGEVIATAQHYLLNSAVQIFRHSITLTAEFPINIEDAVARHLREVLGQHLQRDEEQHPHSYASKPMSSFFDVECAASNHGTTTDQWSEKMGDCSVTVISTVSTPIKSTTPSPLEPCEGATLETLTHQAPSSFHCPAGFNNELFDAAEASILYLVLTNTWRRFVQQHERLTLPS